MLHDGGELALLDVREAGQFGESHLLFATPLPYSRLELDIGALVPRKSARIVLCDDGESGVAELAAKRLQAIGYSNVAVLEGGTRAWARAGLYALFAGVNVPSKLFGELVEHEYHTPRVTVTELARMKEAREDFVIVDGRPFAEYQKMNIPGGICCPNAELPYRIREIVRNPKTKIVVNCAGRTRSILGAQTLINFGVENPVYALENGTQGWVLADMELERGASRRYPDRVDESALPAACRRRREADGAPRRQNRLGATVEGWLRDPQRTTYLLDVRTPEEFKAGSLPGAVHAPGGQLVQATDQWVGVRNARIVLIDSEGVRAPVVASWLKQLGCDVYVLEGGIGSIVAAPAGETGVFRSCPRFPLQSSSVHSMPTRARHSIWVPACASAKRTFPAAAGAFARESPLMRKRAKGPIVLVADDAGRCARRGAIDLDRGRHQGREAARRRARRVDSRGLCHRRRLRRCRRPTASASTTSSSSTTGTPAIAKR